MKRSVIIHMTTPTGQIGFKTRSSSSGEREIVPQARELRIPTLVVKQALDIIHSS